LSDVAQQLSNDFQGQGTTSGGYVGQANQLINQIATLNGNIVAARTAEGRELARRPAAPAVDQLGTLLGVRTTTEPDGP